MKINWNYIKAIVLLGVVALLFSFAKNRNSARKIQTVSIAFSNGDNLYITETTVNKLLIQKQGELKNRPKDTLDLNKLEKALNNNEMIARADVYLSVNGELGINITQRRPIARVISDHPFYVDADGKTMPLSSNHSARVPILEGIEKNNLETVFPLLKKIDEDPFLTHHVVAVEKMPQRGYKLQIRELGFSVLFGDLENIEGKIRNFKAFYKEAMKEGKLKAYKTVNLQFENQVVCTKK